MNRAEKLKARLERRRKASDGSRLTDDPAFKRPGSVKKSYPKGVRR